MGDSFDYANEIWSIADMCRGNIERKDYSDVILPFTLLRRLECALEPTRDAVMAKLAEKESEWGRENDNYCSTSKYAFYNTSTYRLADLGTDTLTNLMAYVDSFSSNVQKIFEMFEFRKTCEKLQNSKPPLLYDVCTKFGNYNLSIASVDSRTMSHIYEHLIQKFGESIAEAAEDFMTPKDVVRLAVSLIMAENDDLLNSDDGVVRTIYDPTCGSGGFILDAMDALDEYHAGKDMKAPAILVPYGQELAGRSWAIAKASLLIRNVATEGLDKYDQMKDLSKNIVKDNTLTNDVFGNMKFDLVFSNPPYGNDYKQFQKEVLDEAALGFGGRFGAGVPPVGDSSMLFLQHVADKMRPKEEGGGMAAIVLSASPLFVGDAGSGPSNIRRWLFEKDLVDMIVKLPTDIFFRTGIATYLWILSTNKPDDREGMVQLIDASDLKTLRRKNLGKKRYDISDEQRDEIVRMHIEGLDHGRTVLVPYTEFFYRRVTVQRPLQRVIRITDEKLREVRDTIPFSRMETLDAFMSDLRSFVNKTMPYSWATTWGGEEFKKLEEGKINKNVFITAIKVTFSEHSDTAPIEVDKYGQVLADPELKDTEDIPFDENFDAYMERNVLPYAPGAWIDETVTDKGPFADGRVGVVGTEVSFNRWFYKYQELPASNDIAKAILAEQDGLEDMLKEIFQ